MQKPKVGFVPLKSLTNRAADPKTALAEIRRIYFDTTRETIEHDFAHAIALLRTLPEEEDRERASVFMEGLTEMRREWEREHADRRTKKGRTTTGRSRSSSSR